MGKKILKTIALFLLFFIAIFVYALPATMMQGFFLGMVVENSDAIDFNEAMLNFTTYTNGHPYIQAIGNYGAFIFMMLAFMLATLIIDRKIFKSYGKKLSGNTLKMLCTGLLCGFGMNIVCILPAIVSGGVSFGMAPVKATIPCLLFSLCMVFIQSSSEEIVCRSYLYYGMNNIWGKTATGFITSCLIFGLLHGANPGMGIVPMINIVLVAVLYAVILWKYNSFWFCCMHHTAWNFTQAFLLGLPNSGQNAFGNVLVPTKVNTSWILYDESFGIEGSLVTTIVYVIVISYILISTRKKTESIADNTDDSSST